jgi:hypothetical protein
MGKDIVRFIQIANAAAADLDFPWLLDENGQIRKAALKENAGRATQEIEAAADRLRESVLYVPMDAHLTLRLYEAARNIREILLKLANFGDDLRQGATELDSDNIQLPFVQDYIVGTDGIIRTWPSGHDAHTRLCNGFAEALDGIDVK